MAGLLDYFRVYKRCGKRGDTVFRPPSYVLFVQDIFVYLSLGSVKKWSLKNLLKYFESLLCEKWKSYWRRIIEFGDDNFGCLDKEISLDLLAWFWIMNIIYLLKIKFIILLFIFIILIK